MPDRPPAFAAPTHYRVGACGAAGRHRGRLWGQSNGPPRVGRPTTSRGQGVCACVTGCDCKCLMPFPTRYRRRAHHSSSHTQGDIEKYANFDPRGCPHNGAHARMQKEAARCQTCRQAFPLAAGGQHNHPCLRAVGEHKRATPHTPGLRDRPGTTTAQRRHAHELTKAETILRAQQATTPHRDCQRQGRKSRPESDCAHRALRRCEAAPAGLKYKRLAGRPG